jgi:hypothetical protein
MLFIAGGLIQLRLLNQPHSQQKSRFAAVDSPITPKKITQFFLLWPYPCGVYTNRYLPSTFLRTRDLFPF